MTHVQIEMYLEGQREAARTKVPEALVSSFEFRSSSFEFSECMVRKNRRNQTVSPSLLQEGDWRFHSGFSEEEQAALKVDEEKRPIAWLNPESRKKWLSKTLKNLETGNNKYHSGPLTEKVALTSKLKDLLGEQQGVHTWMFIKRFNEETDEYEGMPSRPERKNDFHNAFR